MGSRKGKFGQKRRNFSLKKRKNWICEREKLGSIRGEFGSEMVGNLAKKKGKIAINKIGKLGPNMG